MGSFFGSENTGSHKRALWPAPILRVPKSRGGRSRLENYPKPRFRAFLPPSACTFFRGPYSRPTGGTASRRQGRLATESYGELTCANRRSMESYGISVCANRRGRICRNPNLCNAFSPSVPSRHHTKPANLSSRKSRYAIATHAFRAKGRILARDGISDKYERP